MDEPRPELAAGSAVGSLGGVSCQILTPWLQGAAGRVLPPTSSSTPPGMWPGMQPQDPAPTAGAHGSSVPPASHPVEATELLGRGAAGSGSATPLLSHCTQASGAFPPHSTQLLSCTGKHRLPGPRQCWLSARCSALARANPAHPAASCQQRKALTPQRGCW